MQFSNVALIALLALVNTEKLCLFPLCENFENESFKFRCVFVFVCFWKAQLLWLWVFLLKVPNSLVFAEDSSHVASTHLHANLQAMPTHYRGVQRREGASLMLAIALTSQVAIWVERRCKWYLKYWLNDHCYLLRIKVVIHFMESHWYFNFQAFCFLHISFFSLTPNTGYACLCTCDHSEPILQWQIAYDHLSDH